MDRLDPASFFTMPRSIIVVAALGFVLLLAWRRPGHPEVRPAPSGGCRVIDPVWTEWRVLSPRRRGASPTPPIVFCTPGWLGPVEITIAIRGFRHVTVTTMRSVAWPEGLPPLAVGEACSVMIAGPGWKRAEAVCIRAGSRAAPVPDWRPSDTMSRARGW